MSLRTASLLALALTPSTALAQSLVRDINTNPVAGGHGSFLRAPLEVGDELFFSYGRPDVGYELFATDGTAEGTRLIRDINPGTPGSDPEGLTLMPDGRVIFQAWGELWISDGTEDGTELVADINPTGFSNPQSLRRFGEHVYFFAYTEEDGYEIWRSDGTEFGTELFFEVTPGPEGIKTNRSWIQPSSTHLVFQTLVDGATEVHLWSWDDTRLTPLGAHDSAVVWFLSLEPAALDHQVFFKGQPTAEDGAALWVTDGTVGGTRRVGATSIDGPREMVAAEDLVYVNGSTAETGTDLFVTDGTDEGTYAVEINPGSGNSTMTWIDDFGRSAVFLTTHPDYGREPWISDGTPEGTYLLADTYPGPQTPLHWSGTSAGSLYYFTVHQGHTGEELWRTDGTPGGTWMVQDIYPGNGASFPLGYGSFQDRVIFDATHPVYGREIWFSDGTVPGTDLLIDMTPTPESEDSEPELGLAVNGKLLFSADDGIHGREPWISDGTEEGTFMLQDFFTGSTDGFDELGVSHMGKAYFVANDGTHGREPWVTDGTVAGTQLLANVNYSSDSSNPYGFVASHDRVFFGATQPNGRKLFVSRGTPETTHVWTELLHGEETADPRQLFGRGKELFLSAALGATGTEVWAALDGAESLQLVADINPGPASGFSPWTNFAAAGDWVLFGASGGVAEGLGIELWRTDGTAAGTMLVYDLLPGPDDGRPRELTTVRNEVVFTAVNENGKRDLWRSDGTTEGTVRLTQFAALTAANITSLEDRSFFTASQPQGNAQLWTSNGVPAGTLALTNMPNPGAFGWETQLGALGDGPWLAAAHVDTATGIELWLSNGTAAQTGFAYDIAPGPLSGAPTDFVRAGKHLFFSADDHRYGRELHAVDLTTIDAGLTHEFGLPCAGGGIFPSLDLSDEPVAGTTVQLELSAQPNVASLFFGGFAATHLPVEGSCWLHVADPLALAALGTDATGNAALSIALVPELAGLPVVFQALTLDPTGGAWQAPFSMSNGLEAITAP